MADLVSGGEDPGVWDHEANGLGKVAVADESDKFSVEGSTRVVLSLRNGLLDFKDEFDRRLYVKRAKPQSTCVCGRVEVNAWSEEEDKRIFTLYKKYGSSWTMLAKFFEGRTEKNIKNRFYSTLRRIARKKERNQKNPDAVKANILDYVDDALEYGHNCFSKRGRPKKHNKHSHAGGRGRGLKGPGGSQKGQKSALMDTAESCKGEEAQDTVVELNLGFKEIMNVNQSMINLLLPNKSIKQ